MKFADIKNDIAFRKIFGNARKSICLISFLNAVLELQGNNRIKSVTFLSPYLMCPIAWGKASIIDVKATDYQGRKFIVEMQVADKKGFNERIDYFSSQSYAMQKLHLTYFIGVLSFSNDKGTNYISKHLPVNNIKYTFIQLPKFKKKTHELTTPTDKWTYFIKNSHNLKIIPDFVDEEGLLTAFREADKYNWTKEELVAYDNASIKIQDERGEKELVREIALEEGKEIGKEIGKEEGREQEKIETVIKLYRKGKSATDIADLLDMPMEKIKHIIDNYQHK